MCCTFALDMSNRTNPIRRRKTATHNEIIKAVSTGNETELKALLHPIQYTETCYNLLATSSNTGRYPLHYTIGDINLNLLHTPTHESRAPVVSIILENIPRERLADYLKLRDINGRTALQTAAIENEKDAVGLMLDLVTKDDRFELVAAIDNERRNVFNYDISLEMRNFIKSYFLDLSDLESTGGHQ